MPKASRVKIPKGLLRTMPKRLRVVEIEIPKERGFWELFDQSFVFRLVIGLAMVVIAMIAGAWWIEHFRGVAQ